MSAEPIPCENPYVGVSPEDTVCNCSMAIAMLKKLLQREDTEPVTLTFSERYGLEQTLGGSSPRSQMCWRRCSRNRLFQYWRHIRAAYAARDKEACFNLAFLHQVAFPTLLSQALSFDSLSDSLAALR